jgi:hypothetical protein
MSFGGFYLPKEKWPCNFSTKIFEHSSEEDKERMKSSIKNLDRNLGAYPLQSWSKWVSLSSRLRYLYCRVGDLFLHPSFIPGTRGSQLSSRIRYPYLLLPSFIHGTNGSISLL